MLIIIISALIYFNKLSRQASALANNTVVENVDLSTLADGKYIGTYSIDPVYVKVEVIVKDHEFKEIKILDHVSGFGSKAEVIVEDVVKKQSLNVDTISGASVSSKCILKSIEDAVEKGR